MLIEALVSVVTCLGTWQKLGEVRLHQLSIFDPQLNHCLDRPTTSDDDNSQPTPTSTSMKDNGNQPTSTTEGGGDDHQPVRITIFSFFFFCFTNGLPSSSSAPRHTHDVKHREDNGTMHTPSPTTPSAYAHYQYSFFLSFVLLTIYLLAHSHHDFHANSSALHVGAHS